MNTTTTQTKRLTPPLRAPRPPKKIQPTTRSPRTSRPREAPVLTFAPLAWLKLQFFCHAGESEIGGFAVTAARDPLYVERFETVLQGATSVTVEFSDDAVADFFDRCVDEGLCPRRFARVWCHTHPGRSPQPSATDELTFERVFGACDWSMMFILSRTSETYARLQFGAGPGGAVHVPVRVDWERWPADLDGEPDGLDEQMRRWGQEYSTNVHVLSSFLPEPRATQRWEHEMDLLADDVTEAGVFEDYFEALAEQREEVVP